MNMRPVVVIGAASGMGRGVAARYAGEAPLVLADRSDGALEQVASELGPGAEVRHMAVDIRRDDDVDRLVDLVGDEFGSLVITAGLASSMGTWQDIFMVNLVGMARVVRAFTPLVGAGSVAVCVASIAGHRPVENDDILDVIDHPFEPDILARVEHVLPDITPELSYSVSKLGVIRLARRTAVEWGRAGGRCVSLSPGIIDTPMAAAETVRHGDVMPAMLRQTPAGRAGLPREIADVAHFLCSAEASYVTGCDILVDGGFLASRSSGVSQ